MKSCLSIRLATKDDKRKRLQAALGATCRVEFLNTELELGEDPRPPLRLGGCRKIFQDVVMMKDKNG